MIYKALFSFYTNRTTTGLYENIELVFLTKANSFAQAENELKDIINNKYSPRSDPYAKTMSIVKYGKFIMLTEEELNSLHEYQFYEINITYTVLLATSKLKVEKQKLLIQDYSMDLAKIKATEHAQKQSDILFDDFEIKKMVDTGIYEAYL